MPLQGHTAAADIGGDGEAVRPVEVPPAEDKAGGEEEGGEVSGGTAGAAPTSSPAVPITKKKKLYCKDIDAMVGSSSFLYFSHAANFSFNVVFKKFFVIPLSLHNSSITTIVIMYNYQYCSRI